MSCSLLGVKALENPEITGFSEHANSPKQHTNLSTMWGQQIALT